MNSTICVAEDRVSCEPALKILLLSLTKHSPRIAVSLFYPVAKDSFRAWLRKCPQVHLQTTPLRTGYGWNVKPQAMMRLIDEGFDEVIWIDSDVIVTRDIAAIFSNLKSECVAVAEDALGDTHYDADGLRARMWGLPVGRVLPFGMNTGVFRITQAHRGLMERWWTLLQSDEYQAVQKRPWSERPVHMLGDQDVLTALLACKEFSDIPLFILQRGRHIIQFNGVYGYSTAERVKNFLGVGPTFIHSFAGKPWLDQWDGDQVSAREYIKKIYLDLSPYTLSASRFSGDLDCDAKWMRPHYPLSRILRWIGLGYAPLVGLPVAVGMDLVRLATKQTKPDVAKSQPFRSEARLPEQQHGDPCPRNH
jgi:hypothetical protein